MTERILSKEPREQQEWKDIFAEWGLWSLVEDISDDGDGQGDNLQLTEEGLEARNMIKELLNDKQREVLSKVADFLREEEVEEYPIKGTPDNE